MKLTLLQKIGIGMGCLLLLLIAINTLITTAVSKANSVIISGHFRNIIEEKSKGDLSYNLYLYESSESYKITADFAGCFIYDNFKEEIRDGQPITFYIYNGLHFTFGHQIVSIVANKKDYLQMDCINQKISDNKIFLPLGCLIFFVLGGLYLYEKGRRNSKQFGLRSGKATNNIT